LYKFFLHQECNGTANKLIISNNNNAPTLLVGQQEEHLASKKLSGGMLAWLCVWVKAQICMWPR